MQTLSLFLKSIWLYLAGIVAVLALYYLLIGIGQGMDVVIQSGEHTGKGIFMVICCILWAFLLWYSARTLSYIRQQKDYDIKKKSIISTDLHKHLPRLIGFNCFVCVQAGIVNLPSGTAIDGIWVVSGWQLMVFIALHNFLYFLISDALRDDHKKWTKATAIAFILVYIALAIQQLLQSSGMFLDIDSRRHIFWLRLLLIVLFVCECLAVIFFMKRRKYIDNAQSELKRPEALPKSIENMLIVRLMKKLGFREDYIRAEMPLFRIFNLLGIVVLAIYLGGIFFIDISCNMGALAFVLLALGILIGISNLISGASIRIGVNLFLFIFIFAIILGNFYDPYPVRTTETAQAFSYKTRPTTEAYLEKWFQKRIEQMKTLPQFQDTTKTFDVYIALSNGGASRAGQWSSSVLSRIQDESFKKDSLNSFKDHLLCLSGASGGSVGNTAFYGLLKAQHDKKLKGDAFLDSSSSFFHKDFLTFTIARLLGPDILQHLFPVWFMDNRADVLERTFSESNSDVQNNTNTDLLRDYYQMPYSQVIDTTGALPILYITTTQVNNGYPGVISSVKMQANGYKGQRTDVLSLIDSMKVMKDKKDNRITNKDPRTDIRFSTAAVMSSRFPYVSPAGKLYDRYFVDGGYFDNSGAGTMLEFMEQLSDFLKKHNTIAAYKRFRFHILHLTNSEVYPAPVRDINPLTNDMAAPILTLVGIQGSSTSISDGVLQQYFSRQFQTKGIDSTTAYIKYSLYNPKYRDTIANDKYDREPEYPMSWAISDFHFKRMQAALNREYNGNKGKVRF